VAEVARFLGCEPSAVVELRAFLVEDSVTTLLVARADRTASAELLVALRAPPSAS
jgi:hypothetical protein